MITVLLVALLVYDRLTMNIRIRKRELSLEEKYRKLLEEWKTKELKSEASKLGIILEEKYRLAFDSWKKMEENKIRKDAVEKSSAVVLGKVAEQLAPLEFAVKTGINPKDARFIGSPIDYIIFKGLYDGKPREILFVEVKAGKNAKLSSREKEVRKLIEECKVRWVKYDLI
ncbi:MAG: hypothetical protein F7B60_03605 [Desulfurococcales archaeon]|nr:hypothetical protein [Desulfurococcales archaeon]